VWELSSIKRKGIKKRPPKKRIKHGLKIIDGLLHEGVRQQRRKKKKQTAVKNKENWLGKVPAPP